MFRGKLKQPYKNLWIAFVLGALLSSILNATYYVVFFAAPITSIGEWFSALGIVYPFGAFVILVLVMPLIFLAQRYNFSGPASASAVLLFILTVGYFMFSHSSPRSIILSNAISCFIIFCYLAYIRQPSNKSKQQGPSAGTR